MESSRPPTIAKKLWHIFQVVYYMLRKGMPKRKLMMDLHLLLKRGKIAGKALGNLMTSHHHHHHHHHSSSTTTTTNSAGRGGNGFSCRSMDPNLSFYTPREVEFSCSNTPSYPSLAKHSKKRHHHNHNHRDYDYEAATAIAIAKAFEILNAEAASDLESSVAPSPMKTPMLWFGKSPAVVRQLRITDSPFPIKEDEEAAADGEVDKEAEDFITRFYEQLRRQQSVVGATPDYYRVRRG